MSDEEELRRFAASMSGVVGLGEEVLVEVGINEEEQKIITGIV